MPQRVADVLRAANPDASLASWAYRFCCNQPNVLTVLSGMSNLDQVRQNVADYQANRPFSAEEQQALDAAVETLRGMASAALPATNWRLLKNPSAIVAFLSYPRRNRRDRIRLRHELTLRPTCENHRKKGR